VTPPESVLARLQFLVRVARKESTHLQSTDSRIFAEHFGPDRAKCLDEDIDLAERVEAFVGRFGRLQDTLADKLLPSLLTALGERTGAQLDNLDLAERFGYIDSAETWFAMRQLRNQMVHEYIEDALILASALQSGHDFVPVLIQATNTMIAEIDRRGWMKL
jgi:hypothetical protein